MLYQPRCLAGLLIAAMCSVFIQCTEEPQLPPGDPNNGGLFVPGGFEVLVVSDSVGRARHLTVNKNGDIYVKLRYAEGRTKGTLALRDTTGDGKANIAVNFGDYRDQGSLASGITIHNNYLYLSSASSVHRYRLAEEDLIPDSPIETILTDDHEHGVRHWHITKPMAFDGKGNMYVPFGSPSDACQDIAVGPMGIPGGKGLDPCPELEHHGGIWRFDASKPDQTQSDGDLYATGLRSIVGMRWNQQDEHLYAVVHGIDNFHRMFPEIYTAWEGAMLPAEEFVKIEEGDDFGWPYCYYDQIQEKKLLQPGYGGDGEISGRCTDCKDPLLGFPGHWGPNDLLFYQGNQFPERYKNGAFIAFHGSLDRPPYPQAGYFVCFVPFENGQPTGDWEVFADGFTGVDTVFHTSDAQHRPMGLAEGPDGSLYISDSKKGKIWRVMFKGDRSSFGPPQLSDMETRKQLSHLRTPDELRDNLERDRVKGKLVYDRYCATCHQGNGKGDENRFPPLLGSEWVTGDKERLIKVVLEGLQGPIQVSGKTYNNLMPGFGYLSDQQLSVILTYVRDRFGSGADPISEEDVKQFRSDI